MYWLDVPDLHPAIRELAGTLGLTVTDEDLAKLDDELIDTWYGSDHVDGRSVPGRWATLRHAADHPRLELAYDECGGVFIHIWCDESVRRRAVEVLARFNPLNQNLG